MSTAACYLPAENQADCRPKRVGISYELYPPRNPEPTSSNWAGIDKLLASRPDYVSVTFGTGGSTKEASQAVLRRAMEVTSSPALAHLTCVGRTRGQLDSLVCEMLENGVRDFLALRGDPPKGQSKWSTCDGGLSSAAALIELIREVALRELGDAKGVDIAVAAYPAGDLHSRLDAVAALSDKANAGADYAITQVFYQASDYRDLKDAASFQGVNIPIIPGVIPFTDISRLQRLENLSGVRVPPDLSAIGEIADSSARLRASLAATVHFLDELLALGAPGLHFYTFNRARPTLDLVEHLRAHGFAPADPSQREALLDLAFANLKRGF